MQEVQQNRDQKEQYEIKNILERWLLTLSNDQRPNDKDPILVPRKLIDNYSANTKMYDEMKDKKILDRDDIYSTVLEKAHEWTEKTEHEKCNIPVIVNENTININGHERTLPPQKLSILRKLNDSLVSLGSMVMRYECLLIGEQQWAVPLEMYQFAVKNYGVSVEGFASPINSQILYINENLKYCSIFPDTDIYFGSIGSFFDANFDGKSVYVNPPYVLDIMNKVASHIESNLKNAKTFARFFVNVPDWTDTDYYKSFTTSEYLKLHHKFGKKHTIT